MNDEVTDALVRDIMARAGRQRECTEEARAECEATSAALPALADAHCERAPQATKPRHLHLVWSRPE